MIAHSFDGSTADVSCRTIADTQKPNEMEASERASGRPSTPPDTRIPSVTSLTKKSSEEMQEKNHTIDKCRGRPFRTGNDFLGSTAGGFDDGGGDGSKPGANVDKRTRESGKNRWLRICAK